MPPDSCSQICPITFPPPAGQTQSPVWTGRTFRIGDCETAVLSYATGRSGWTDELTAFHEATAGDDHYIDRASQKHTLSQVRHWLGAKPAVIMDVGCSSGAMLKLLLREFRDSSILGADYVRGPLDVLAGRLSGVPLLQFDLTACPLPDRSLDGIVLLNVLEHIEEDDAALAQIARILKPGGIVVIEVPAGPNLYDIYDRQLLHHRRYRMRELIEKVSCQGLRVLTQSHLGFFLYPAFWVTKKRGRRFLTAEQEIQRAIVSRQITSARTNPLLYRIMDLEAKLRSWIYYPFGIRCLLTCQRPEV
jgi:ubiquinone/menaquinone biosynthesis C-methylase UbiE